MGANLFSQAPTSGGKTKTKSGGCSTTSQHVEHVIYKEYGLGLLYTKTMCTPFPTHVPLMHTLK